MVWGWPQITGHVPIQMGNPRFKPLDCCKLQKNLLGSLSAMGQSWIIPLDMRMTRGAIWAWTGLLSSGWPLSVLKRLGGGVHPLVQLLLLGACLFGVLLDRFSVIHLIMDKFFKDVPNPDYLGYPLLCFFHLCNILSGIWWLELWAEFHHSDIQGHYNIECLLTINFLIILSIKQSQDLF